MLHSKNIPDVNYSPDINDLFHYFGINWNTLSPVIFLLVGLGFGFFILKLVMRMKD